MERSTINHAKSGDTNPGGQPRSWLLKLYARALPSGREGKNSARNFCRLRRQTALWYTLDDDHGKEREVRNCPPKRVRSTRVLIEAYQSDCVFRRDLIGDVKSRMGLHQAPVCVLKCT